MTEVPHPPIAWAVSPGLVAYDAAVRRMEEHVAGVRAGTAPELVWLLEHPPIYTAGTSAREEDLINPEGLPVYSAGRGGQFTYHGPGQRIAYVMLDVKRRFTGDVRAFVAELESWIVASLVPFGLTGLIRPGRVGVWVEHGRDGDKREEKIAALGIRIRHGVSFHGISLNVSPNLAHYGGIVPCGISEYGVTSLSKLGVPADMKAVDSSLEAAFETAFGPIARTGDPLAG